MRIIFIMLLFLSFMAHAVDIGSRPTILFIKKTINEDETLYKYPISDENVFTRFQDVWQSARGIKCSSLLVSNGKSPISGSFECNTPEGYKAQISFDCSINHSKDTSAYFFFGLVGAQGNNGNFYIWCE